MSAKNILILGVQVPFTRGGAEVLIEKLATELKKAGHFVDLVQLPFSALPKKKIIKHMAEWSELDLSNFAGRDVDLVIPTKFPSYLVTHPNKALWLIHQHRQAYELYDTRFGDFSADPEDEILRQTIMEADEKYLPTCREIFTIASNVSLRLERYLQIKSKPLLPPVPLEGRYSKGEKGDYILSVGRLCSIKRVDLVVRAMSKISRSLKLKIVGGADEPAIETYLKSEVRKHELGERVEFLGRVSDEKLLSLFANCFAVYYAPHNEDYGFVTLEARASGKPVVTAEDSGTVLDFIRDRENGLVAAPDEEAIAEKFNQLFDNQELYQSMSFVEDPAMLTTPWKEILKALVGSN